MASHTRLFLKSTQTEPGTSGTVRDLGPTTGVGGSHGLGTTERRRYQMVVTGPVAKSIPTSLSVNTFSGGREARWRILRLASDGLTILDESVWSPLVSTVGVHTATLEFETIWREGELIAMQVESLDNGGTFSFDVEDADSFIDATFSTAPTAPELLVEIFDGSAVKVGEQNLTDLSHVEEGVEQIIATSDIAAPQTAEIHLTNTGRTLAVWRLLGSETATVAPALVSATTNAARTEILLTFDRAMASPVGEHGAFSWREDGGARSFSAAALDADPTIIVLTIDGAAAVLGAAIDVSYTPGTVESADGVALGAFTERPLLPVLVSAAASTDGTEIRATFDKAMASPVGEHAAFSFDEDAVGRSFSAAALDGGDASVIVLTVNGAAIVHTVPLTLSYVPGTVEAADGEVLAAFTDEEVENLVFAPPVVASAFTNDAGTTVTYRHDRDMADPTGEHTVYSFREDAGGARGYTAAALGADPRDIVLTVDGAAITAGATLDGSYTPGTVQSAEGKALAAFTNEPIANAVESDLEIVTTLLPLAERGESYSHTLEVEGGTAPYSWDVTLGGFPTGISLALATGVFSGTVDPAAETRSATLRVTDSVGAQAIREFTIKVVDFISALAAGTFLPVDTLDPISVRAAAGLAEPDRATFVRVKLEDPDGVMQDMSDLLSEDFFDENTVQASADQPISRATFTFWRAVGDKSLSPLMEGSTLNRDAQAAYAPRLRPWIPVSVEIATLLPGETPIATDWAVAWEGLIDDVDWAREKVVCNARDRMAILNDTLIETVTTYGADDGSENIDEVMQEILDDAFGVGVWPITVVGTPTLPIAEYELGHVSVLEALTALADLIGWNLHYKWDPSVDGFRVTFYEPDRSDLTPVWTFGPDDYYDVSSVALDVAGIRNKAEVVYTDLAGTQQSVNETRTASVALYGTRFIRVDAQGTSINTATQANNLLSAVLDDLESPKAVQEIEAALFWPIAIGDVHKYLANGVHYDTDQTWACFGYTHTITPSRLRTVIQAAGKPSGGFQRWHRFRASDPLPTRTLVVPASAFGGSAGELHPSAPGTTEEHEAPVQGIPVGSLITEFTSVMARANAADIAESKLVNPTYLSPFGWAEFAGWDNTHGINATDYTTEAVARSIEVTDGKPLTIRVRLRGDASINDAALAYIRIKYRLGAE